jgi:hypothetical protein
LTGFVLCDWPFRIPVIERLKWHYVFITAATHKKIVQTCSRYFDDIATNPREASAAVAATWS